MKNKILFQDRIRLSRWKELRIRLSLWRGRSRFDIRLWTANDEGKMVPTKKGAMVAACHVIKIAEAANAAKTHARRIRLIPRAARR